MTQSKIAIAKRLAELRQDGSDPETLAKTMTVMKMHHEIENIIESRVEEPETAPVPETAPEPEPEEEKSYVQSIFETFFGVDRD
jgi:hypothetical protein